MQSEIKIRNSIIGEGNPLFIVAECGVTCNYDMKIAKELIDVVQESGADAIKFIFWFPEEFMSDKTITYEYDSVNGRKSENMFEMLDKLRFSIEQWQEIKAYADEKNVILFSTVNSPSGIIYAEKLGLEAYKLSSWDTNYEPLLRKIAEIGKPIILDTGPINTLELSKYMQIMKDAGNEQSIVVHCFHTEIPSEMNMRSIPYIKQAFNTLVGYSATDYRDEQDIVAVSLGAIFLEKRLTMSRSLPGHHHVLSKEPEEFKRYVQIIRDVHASLGTYDLIPSPGDIEARNKYFRHLVANQDIPAGTILKSEMLEGKRPEKGISPEYIEFFIGRRTKRELKYNDALTWDVV